MTMFDQPSSGAWLKPAELEGHLVLIAKVHEIAPRFDQFKNTDVDTATIDYADLDAATPTLIERASSAHPGIVRKLHTSLRTGRPVLGRIGKVPTDKGNPAWVLGPFTEGVDDTRASAWWTAHQAGQFNQPAAPRATVQPPAPQPASAQVGTKTVELNAEQQEKLRALGIVA